MKFKVIIAFTDLTRDVQANKHFLVIEQHAVDCFDSSIGRLGSFVVHKSIALGVASLIGGDFAGKDVSEGNKGIMKGLCQTLGNA